MASEQRRRLKAIESELVDVRRSLDRPWEPAESTGDLETRITSIRANNELKERLDASAAEAEVSLGQRRVVKADTAAIIAWARGHDPSFRKRVCC